MTKTLVFGLPPSPIPLVGYQLRVNTNLKDQKILKSFNYKKNFVDSLSAEREIQNLIQSLHNRSYLLASLDSISYKKINKTNYVDCYIYIGSKYKLKSLQINSDSAVTQYISKVKTDVKSGRFFVLSEYEKTLRDYVVYYENHGYPFASTLADTLRIEKNAILINLKLNPGPLIYFDSLRIHGTTKTKKRFIEKYLQVYKDDYYDNRRVSQSWNLLRQLPFLEITKKPEVEFYKDMACLHLYLKDKPNNEIDGIIGLVPGNEVDKNLQLTGQFNLHLRNVLSTGKSFRLEWEKLDKYSQNLEVEYTHPNLLVSRLEGSFNIINSRFDTTFSEQNWRIKLKQGLGERTYLSFYGGIESSRIISFKQYNKEILPPYIDFDLNSYGLGYENLILDDFFYPRKGHRILMELGIGNKKILPHAHFGSGAYKDLKMESQQINFISSATKYSKIGKSFVLKNKVKAGMKINESKILFKNDLFRLGGLKNLRGFNEQSMYAAKYVVNTVEVQVYTEANTFIFLFYDQGYYEKPEEENGLKLDVPFGFGPGISFGSKVGIFNFVYALGGSKEQILSINTAKVHFGFTSRF